MTNATEPIDFTDYYLDSRDLIARLEYLADAERDYQNGDGDALERVEGDELATLRKVAEELNYHDEWEDGITFINDTCTEEWARDEARGMGYNPAGLASWITNNIDWEGVADDLLRYDYDTVDIDGNTFHYRSY